MSEINVKDFGAVGDGVTDDSVAIQRAVNSLPNLINEVSTLFFPPGTYLFSNSISLPNISSTAGFYIKGSGWNSILLFQGSGPAITFADTSLVSTTISDLSIRGTNLSDPSDTTQTAAIDFDDASFSSAHITLRNLYIERFMGGAGIILGNTTLSRVEDCRVFYCGTGIRHYRAFDSVISGNMIRHWDQYGIEVEGLDGGSPATGIRVVGNVIDEPTTSQSVCLVRSGVHLVRTRNAVIEGNHFEDVQPATGCSESTVPIRLDTEARGTQILVNYFGPNNVDPGDTGAVIVVDNAVCSDSYIRGNTLGFDYDIQDNGTRTTFQQVFSGTGGLTGASNTRLGWIADSSGIITYLRDKTTSITSDVTANIGDVILSDASGGPITITLPPVANAIHNKIRVKKVDSSANIITIDGDGADTIDGNTTISLTVQYESYTLISDGSEWFII